MELMEIEVRRVLPNPQQPRVEFNAERIRELAQSIEANGLIQPIIVEQEGENYILIDGERRLRAAKLLKWSKIPANVRENGSGADDRLVQALVANLQREDLDPVEEAEAYRELNQRGYNLLEISRMVGVSYPSVSNRMKLLGLDAEIQALVRAGKIPVDRRSTAALLSVTEPEMRVKLARRLARPGLKIDTVVAACKKLNKLASSQKSDDGDLLDEDRKIPAMRTAFEERSKPSNQRWNALKQTGQVPPWQILRKSVQDACEWCVLGSMATPEVCRDCPLVKCLSEVMELVQRHD